MEMSHEKYPSQIPVDHWMFIISVHYSRHDINRSHNALT
jgi:hypothetical protein